MSSNYDVRNYTALNWYNNAFTKIVRLTVQICKALRNTVTLA